ncbi:MAG: DNA polymerase IV [Myxococcota bacterium]
MVDRQILHLDMDAFFAAVEQHDDPSLKGKPVLVGGASRRGVVAASSYEARAFGIYSAMPMVTALRRCPQAIVVSPSRGRYSEVSAQVFSVFKRYTPLVEGLSIDEAFLDVTESRALFGDGETIAGRIRREVRRETGLTVSAGVAPSKFVAKIASDLDKPDGLVVVPPDGVTAFLTPLPIERMWGVGKVAARRLHRAGLDTLGDLARADPVHLESLLGIWGRDVHRLARGEDNRDVHPGNAAKSIGHENTFEVDYTTSAELEKYLLGQAQRVAYRLCANDLCGTVVQVKLKYSDFKLMTRQLALSEPIDDTDSIFDAARELLQRFPRRQRGVRLTGVSVAGLRPGPPPRTLFPDPTKQRREKIQAVTDAILDRFGSHGITRATLVDVVDTKC